MAYDPNNPVNRRPDEPLRPDQIHDPINEQPLTVEERRSGGLVFIIAAVVVVLLIAFYAFRGSDTATPEAPAAGAPAAITPAPDSSAPATTPDPAAEPSGAIPGVEPMVPAEPAAPAEPAPAAPGTTAPAPN